MSRPASLIGAALTLVLIGCADRPGAASQLDGVYRVTVSATELAATGAVGESPENRGSWILVVDRGRFAVTRENERACSWAYGALVHGRGNVMSWTVIDGGAAAPGAPVLEPMDSHRFRWSRYRDVLVLSPLEGVPARRFAAKPWRRIATAPTAEKLSRHCPPPAAALQPTGAEHARPSAGTEIDFSGDFRKTGPATWEGAGTSDELGRGNLRIAGAVRFAPPWTRTRLTFAARFSAGELRGCAINDMLRRPHGRYLWGGAGQITSTSPALRAYRGLAVNIGGVTMTNALTRMHGGLQSPSTRIQRELRAAPRDLC